MTINLQPFDVERGLREATARLDEQRRQQNAARRPRRRNMSLSNTDSIRRAMQIRSKLLSQLNEVMLGLECPRMRDAAAAEVKMQLDRVDQMISSIRRRQRALEQERMASRDDTPSARRRRHAEIQQRSISIRPESPAKPFINWSAVSSAMSHADGVSGIMTNLAL